jgi:YD repeat-containing protein
VVHRRGSDGSVYVCDKIGDTLGGDRIRRIAPDGIITTYAGGAPIDQSGEGDLATAARFGSVKDIAFAPDGTLYVADLGAGEIRAIGPDGIVHRVAGQACIGDPTPCPLGHSGDGGTALGALITPFYLAVDSDGTIYFSEAVDPAHYVRRISPDGTIATVAGNGQAPGGALLSGEIANAAPLSFVGGLVLEPDHSLCVLEDGGSWIGRLQPPLPGFGVGDTLIPSADGSEVYVLSPTGRHLRTLDGLTGATRLTFSYDPEGRLVLVTDAFGNTTGIEGDPSGAPTAIVGPYGARTVLGLDADGYLASVTDPAGSPARRTGCEPPPRPMAWWTKRSSDPIRVSESRYPCFGRPPFARPPA